jgi:hypothetical protein
MNIDLSLNRVYWEYVQNKSWRRPVNGYLGSSQVPSIGVRVTVPPYKTKGASIKTDLTALVKQFAEKYKDYKYVLALSGGIDSEITAETFYELGIPFRALTQSLFDGTNKHDTMYAVKYCKDRSITHHVLNLSYDKMLEAVIPDAVKHGQFTHSYSQIALTNLFKYVKDDEILIFSGHNPDFHRGLGVGWWEDSPNIVKYAINTNNRFFTFTSLEPVFCHYAQNFDGSQPGDKDNDFLYSAYPQLRRRVKMTGWENNVNMIPRLEDRIRYLARHQHMTYITWDYFTLKYIRQLYLEKAIK